jgi:hypothetical protein
MAEGMQKWRLLRPPSSLMLSFQGPPSDEIYSDEKDTMRANSEIRQILFQSRGIRQAAQKFVELEYGSRQLIYILLHSNPSNQNTDTFTYQVLVSSRNTQ